MAIRGPSVPGDRLDRLLWTGLRLLVWFVLFILLEQILAALLGALPLPAAGPYALLPTGATLAAAVLAGVLLLRMLDQRPASDLGFGLTRGGMRLLFIGLGIGAAALLAVAAISLAFGWLGFRADEGSAHGWLVTLGRDLLLLGVAGAAEEAMFRGYPFQVLMKAAGPLAAVVLGSAAFAWAHGSNPNVGGAALLNIFLAGVLLSVSYIVTRSLWIATGIHVGWNWSMASLVDLPVSGLELFDTPLYEPVLSGPSWFTGGPFGPEGGLAGTLAFGGALLLLLGLARRGWITNTMNDQQTNGMA